VVVSFVATVVVSFVTTQKQERAEDTGTMASSSSGLMIWATRSNSVSLADMRNIVCLCRHHYGHFKPEHSRFYWELVHRHIGPERAAWLDRVEQDKRPNRFYLADWKAAYPCGLKAIKFASFNGSIRDRSSPARNGRAAILPADALSPEMRFARATRPPGARANTAAARFEFQALQW